MNSTATPVQSGTASVINARDFSNSVTDTLRDTWTMGKMYHMVKALKGAPVAITTDKQTGHTVVNVTLAYVGPSASGGNGAVYYDYMVFGVAHRSAAGLPGVGMIMTMDHSSPSAKWDALRSYREHCSAAIAVAQKQFAEATGRLWGRWSARVVNGSQVAVRYEPSTGNQYFADRWGKPGSWVIHVEG